MLVISRRPLESIVFPSVGITIKVARIGDKVARIAVDAPRSIPVFRQELLEDLPPGPSGDTLADVARKARHDFLGRLNTATVALHLAQRQLQKGFHQEADLTLRKAMDGLAGLEEELNNPTIAVPKPTSPPQPLRALLVEDNANESALLQSYLQMSGIEVDRAFDGIEALEYLSNRQAPDVVLLDMGLPRCDGPTTARAIRSNQSLAQVKLFVVSGQKPEETSLPAGVDGWFSKPLNPSKLIEALATA